MPTPTTTMRIDEDVKRQAKPILEELGLNISSATNVFLKAVVRCNGLPFNLKLAATDGRLDADFAADYLAPIMSGRNAIVRAGYNPTTYRKRLLRRNEIINQDRRTIE